MRLTTIASALAIVLCVAIFGAIFLQRVSIPVPATRCPTGKEPCRETILVGQAQMAVSTRSSPVGRFRQDLLHDHRPLFRIIPQP
jgi:hypothetical protein